MYFFVDESSKVANLQNSTAFKEISILGLFGNKDITLSFNKEMNIYIGENGLGKTTVLNCVYYILKNQYEKLLDVPFDKIIVKLIGERVFKISKADVAKYFNKTSKKQSYRYREVYSFIEDTLERNNLPINALYDDETLEIISLKISRMFGIPFSQANSFVWSYIASVKESKTGNEENILSLREAVSNLINERVIYLTTYRRIEKDYSEYFTSDKERFNRFDDGILIRFGMKDVSKSINDILGIIREKTNQGFNKMTGILLSKYANMRSNKSAQPKEIDSDLLKIVLNRLGQQIDDSDKIRILELVSNGEIDQPEYKYLRDLIGELIYNYDQLKKYDEKILLFKETCNKYLTDKEFRYNQSDLTLKIISQNDNREIELSMLSSGEKQIVSLFSKLYLESDKECILLIDEPELSISMRWQKMLLPDIMRSGNCKLLLTVTHSPFIFDNEFDEYAQDMWYCLKKR